jgi:hypothetical protein
MSHMTPEADRIKDPCPTDVAMTIGNGTRVLATHIGIARVKALVGDGSTHDIELQNTL